MERIMSVEEKIRRAEEIYERRKQGEYRPVAKVTVNDKKDVKLLKKMIIQILISAFIYLIIFVIQNNQYIFSDDFINKINEILSYDTNFVELYEMIKNNIMKWMNEPIPNNQNEPEQENTEESSIEKAIGGAQESVMQNIDENIIEKQDVSDATKQDDENLSQDEKNIKLVKETISFIKPIEGTISSKYGYRDTATGRVPKNHTGTDIAAPMGTKIKSSTEGEVVLASEEGDYRKAFKNSDWRCKYYICTL